MARRSLNPLAFVPIQVTLVCSTVYIVLFAILIWVHTTVPSAPSTSTPADGVNLTESWLDLGYITDGFHPIDSRRNAEVKAYLLKRIEEIMERNEIEYKVVKTNSSDTRLVSHGEAEQEAKPVTVFVDELSNVTFANGFAGYRQTRYGESENVIVYIRGSGDEDDDWWLENEKYEGQAGVLVNAHYDSVSSGFGATDDGVGVVTLLQLISHFTTDGHQPKRGIVALFNNGEENGLYGAHFYLQHPLSQFTHTFLNLEGAGAGGRATLFRSTDTEVTKFYAGSPHPFGNVVSGDGFKRGLIRSGTDYSVFNGDHGMRGLDVAFFQPRARYHTDQDDARDTSRNSVWHMLSASLATTDAMTSYEGDEFDGGIDDIGKLNVKTGSDGVWFDMFGKVFAVASLSTLFALSLTLSVAAPIILLILEILLRRSDKWYPLSKRQYVHSSDDDEAVHFSGLRGLFRFPIAFVLSTAAVLALAYLQAKINPYIIYSGEYAVWAMMLTAWLAVAWFFFAGADRVRPTALQRMYTLIWLYALTWVMLVAALVGEHQFQLAGGYFIVIYNASVFFALLISYIELFALPTKSSYVEHVANADEQNERRSTRRASSPSRQVLGQNDRPSRANEEEEEATERTSLLRGGTRRGGSATSGGGSRRHPENDGTLSEVDDPYLSKAYGDEQAWSSSLPQWTWIVQFLILAPINIIIIGQISLLLTAALGQTPADGNPPLPIYLFVAVLTTLLLLPLTPFLHRFAYQVPTFLFLIFAGCLLYNLFAFPFSRDARLKVYFVQRVDLNTGINNVSLLGLDGFVQNIISELPSAIGQTVECSGNGVETAIRGLTDCQWHGLEPNVLVGEEALKGSLSAFSDHQRYSSWVDFNVSHSENSASFSIRGRNTKHCHLVFDQPVFKVEIEDAATDPRYPIVDQDGSTQVRLSSRTWDKNFKVNVTWSDQDAKGQRGKVLCLWSDINQFGTIPAYDELRRFQPVWSAATKASDGLVEGWKDFKI